MIHVVLFLPSITFSINCRSINKNGKCYLRLVLCPSDVPRLQFDEKVWHISLELCHLLQCGYRYCDVLRHGTRYISTQLSQNNCLSSYFHMFPCILSSSCDFIYLKQWKCVWIGYSFPAYSPPPFPNQNVNISRNTFIFPSDGDFAVRFLSLRLIITYSPTLKVARCLPPSPASQPDTYPFYRTPME